MGRKKVTAMQLTSSEPIPANQTAKTLLARTLNEVIDERALTQSQVAELTGMAQPKVSKIRRFDLQNISLERLMQALVALNQRVEIVVRPAPNAATSGITVMQR